MSQFKTANLASVVDLRSATDEKLPIALHSLGYQQSFALVDTRLALGYLSAIAAGLAFYAEKKLSFNDALPYTTLLLVLYVIICTASWAHSKFVEKSIVYKGTKENQTLEISGKIDKHVPEYKLSFTLSNKKASAITFSETLKFTKIFDKFGNLHEAQLKAWVNQQIEANTKEN